MDSSAVNRTGPSVQVRYIRPSELHEILNEPPQGLYDLIDIRKNDEYSTGHIEGAKLIPIDSLEERVMELDHERVTILYCKSGMRCQRGARILGEKGWHDICVLEGGYDAYRSYLKTLK
jgi:rhodanese-related sulfurtransferase